MQFLQTQNGLSDIVKCTITNVYVKILQLIK